MNAQYIQIGVAFLAFSIPVVVTIVGGFFVFYSKTNSDIKGLTIQLTALVKTVDGLVKRVGEINLEVHPAEKNGGFITSDQFERRLKLHQEALQVEVNGLFQKIDNFGRSNSLDHGLNEKRMIDIIKKIMEEKGL